MKRLCLVLAVIFICVPAVLGRSNIDSQPLAYNDTEQLAFFMTQAVNNPTLASSLAKQVLTSWNFNYLPNVFAQTAGAHPPENSTQLPNFGALIPWSQILSMLDRPSRKLFIFIRHGQAWENLTPGGDNTLCQFTLNGTLIQNFDSDLSTLGLQQASELNSLLASPSNQEDASDSASWFQTMGLDSAAFFVSPLSRTMQTAYGVFGNLTSSVVTASELIRASIGHDVCNVRRPVQHSLDAEPFPPPFNTECNTTVASLKDLYGNLPGLSFDFPIRPPGAPGIGLISEFDTLWRSDLDESAVGTWVRAVAFYAEVFAVVRESIVAVVTHSEMIDALYAVAHVPGGYRGPANTEVVPIIVESS